MQAMQAMPVRTSPRVLLSRRAAEQLGGRIAEAAQPAAVEIVVLEDLADDDTQTVDAVFISRDITGPSTKSQPSEALARCYGVIRRSPGLRWVHTHSAGADRPIYGELMARGVAVSTSSGANARVVAHTALAGVLALARCFPPLWAAQAERRWAPLVSGPLPHDLDGQTAVIVGWGPIGQALQAMLAPVGLHTLIVRHRPEPAAPGLETATYDDLARVLPRADWLLLCCPLTARTRGLVDAAALRALPAGARIVNVARGEVVVEAALVQALQDGHLGGAFLDVFEHEPLAHDSPLWRLPGVMVSPHSAGHSDGNAARVATIFVDNLRRWLRSEPLRNVVSTHPTRSLSC
jgi:phosphoglycerate dehydrogenase-like enzyme